MKSVRIQLWRRSPPFCKSVTLGQITVAGFLGLLRLLIAKASTVRLQVGKDITPEEMIRSLREPEFNALADSICKGEPAGFFSGWLSLRNVTRLYQASFRVNDWKRIFSCVDWTAKKKRKGSLMGDIQTMCQIFPSLNPMVVQNEWPMEDFLAFVDAMNLQVKDEEPMPIQLVGMIPGVEIVH